MKHHLKLFPVFILFFSAPLITKAQQQAAGGELSKEVARALKVICPQNDDICKLLKELQIKVTRFRQQEQMKDTEGLFANVEGIKYVFKLIDERYKKMPVKPLELTHFLQSRYNFIVIYLHSYLNKYRKKLIADIEVSWKERKQHFACFKQELESANPSRHKLNNHKDTLTKIYQKLIKQNKELKEMYETLEPVYTALVAKEPKVTPNLQAIKEKIIEQNFLLRKLRQDLERIPR